MKRAAWGLPGQCSRRNTRPLLRVLSGYGRGRLDDGSNSLAVDEGLMALGVVVFAEGIASLLPTVESKAGQIGFGVEVCGVAMAIVSAWLPGMAYLVSFAMLLSAG